MSELGESACGGGGGDDWCAVDGRRTDGRSVGRSVGGSVGGRGRECVGRTKRRKGRGEKRRGGSAKFAVRRAGRKRGIYYGSGLLVVWSKLEARLVARLVLGGSEGGDRSNDVDVYSSVGISRAPPRGAVSASRGISFSFSLSSFVYILSVSLPFSLSLSLLFSRSPIAGGARR